MYGNLSLVQNQDGSTDLIIRYTRNDAEFGLDFLSLPDLQASGDAILHYLKKFGRGVRVRSVKILVGGLVVAVMPFGMLLQSQAASERYSMAYLYTGTQSQQIQYVRETAEDLHTVSPSYFDLTPTGELLFNAPESGIVKQLHDMGKRVVPFLSNHWDRQSGILALENEDLAQNLADLIELHEFDGVNIDLENLLPAQREAYVEFVASLREKLPPEKEISVAVAANPKGWDTGWHGSYDYAGLAEYADNLVLMTYDEHYQGGSAGPVAGISFVEDSINYALAQTSPDKIMVGLPLFGRIWGAGGFNGNGVALKQVRDIIELYNAEISYDESAQSPKAVFTVKPEDEKITINGKTLQAGSYEIWYENDRSIQAKLALTDKYDLKGASSWALGQQTPDVWQAYHNWLINAQEDLPKQDSAGETGESALNQAPARPSKNSATSRSSGGGGGGGGTNVNSAAITATQSPALPFYATVQEQTTLYKQPKPGFATTTKLAPKTRLTLLEKAGDFWKVRLTDGSTGYLAKSAVRADKTAVITTDAVKLYDAPNTAGKVLLQATTGSAVRVLQELPDGFSKIALADKTVGFVQTKALAALPTLETITVKKTTTSLNLRLGAVSTSPSLGIVPKGAKVLQLGAAGGYAKVAYNGTIGYLSNAHIL